MLIQITLDPSHLFYIIGAIYYGLMILKQVIHRR